MGWRNLGDGGVRHSSQLSHQTRMQLLVGLLSTAAIVCYDGYRQKQLTWQASSVCTSAAPFSCRWMLTCLLNQSQTVLKTLLGNRISPLITT